MAPHDSLIQRAQSLDGGLRLLRAEVAGDRDERERQQGA
jgi:hypothetical protein